MKRNSVFTLAFGGVFFLVILVFQGCFNPSSSTPTEETNGATKEAKFSNVIFIVVDTLRAERLTMKRGGIPLMPFLDDFANKSWNFTNATAQATWTRPSMASTFTSLYSGVHNQQFGIKLNLVEGQNHTVDVLPEDIETMAVYLKRAGYATIGIQANWNMQPVFGVARGFDKYEMIPNEKTADDITTLALEEIKQATKPFFLYVHYIEPHAPYEPPEAYRTIFGPLPEITDNDRKLLVDYGTKYYADRLKFDLGFRDAAPEKQFSEPAKEYIKIMYDAEVRFADDQVGRLIKGAQTIQPNSIIIFASDHGEELWERGSIGHGKTVYEEVAHVPLIISFPDEPPRKSVQRVELIDILPTVATRLGLPKRDWWQGHNLLAQEESGRPVFTQTMTSVREANVYLLAVLQNNHKLICDLRKPSSFLYNLEKDPGELSSIPEEVNMERLKKLVDNHLQSNRNHPYFSLPSITQMLDPQTEEILKSQGYL